MGIFEDVLKNMLYENQNMSKENLNKNLDIKDFEVFLYYNFSHDRLTKLILVWNSCEIFTKLMVG